MMTSSSTSTTESNVDAACRKLREMLCCGELVPGQRLSQSRLGRQLRRSSMPVVEAMGRLESKCLLLNLLGSKPSRREWLRVGGLRAIGLSLPMLLQSVELTFNRRQRDDSVTVL